MYVTRGTGPFASPTAFGATETRRSSGFLAGSATSTCGTFPRVPFRPELPELLGGSNPIHRLGQARHRAVGPRDSRPSTRRADGRPARGAGRCRAECPAIFGISEGGPMSILFAATYPERVQSLVLYGTLPRFSPSRRITPGASPPNRLPQYGTRSKHGGAMGQWPNGSSGHSSRCQASSISTEEFNGLQRAPRWP